MDSSLGCLVCSAKSILKAPVIPEEAFEIYLKRLFQYLLIPREFTKELLLVCTQRNFCSSCLRSAQEIVDLQTKISTLELQIQYRVENMGKAVVAVTSQLEANCVANITEKWSDVSQQLWLKFRYPVIQSFAQGYLPTPSVVVKQCTSAKQPSSKSVSEGEAHEKLQRDPSNFGSKDFALKAIENGSVDSERDVRKNRNVKRTAKSPENSGALKCPVCPYKEESREIRVGERASRVRLLAREKRLTHYQNIHMPVCIVEADVSAGNEGNTYYRCPACPFKSEILCRNGDTANTPKMKTQRKYAAFRVLSRHHITLHSHDTNVRNRRKTVRKAALKMKEYLKPKVPVTNTRHRNSRIRLLKIPDLVDGKYYFTCPIPNCEFCYSSDYTDTDCPRRLKYKVRYGLHKLGDHYIRNHSKETSACVNNNDPYAAYLEVEGESQKLKCPWTDECSYSVKVDKSNLDRLLTCQIFSRHVAVHVYNGSLDPQQPHRSRKNISRTNTVTKKSAFPGYKLARSKYTKNKPITKNSTSESIVTLGLNNLTVKMGTRGKQVVSPKCQMTKAP